MSGSHREAGTLGMERKQEDGVGASLGCCNLAYQGCGRARLIQSGLNRQSRTDWLETECQDACVPQEMTRKSLPSVGSDDNKNLSCLHLASLASSPIAGKCS